MLDARILGQLSLMQSILATLPDEASIFSFVCRGLRDLPGAADVQHLEHPQAGQEATVSFRLQVEDSDWGELRFDVSDPAAFAPYEEYLRNFCFMIAVILHGRRQRQELEHHRSRLEEAVEERTRQLVAQMAEKERSEAALRESEDRFRTLAQAVPQVVWMCQPDGQCIYFNQKWCEYTGLTLDESYGEGWIKPFHPDDRPRAWATWQQAVSSGGRYELEARLRRANGEYRWFLMRGLPMRDTRGAIFRWFGTCTDVEDHKRVEQQLVEANRVKDQFLAKLSHELRTPLTPVRIAVQQWEAQPDFPPAAREDLQMVRRNLDLELRLLDDLLDLNRILHGKLALHRQVIDLHQTIADALEVVAFSIQSKHLEISTHLEARHSQVEADPTRLLQIFWNLLNNAIKFTPEQGAITIRAGNDRDNRVWVSISDTGIGIAPEMLPRLFKPFEQCNHGHTAHSGGLGLGLSICKSLMDLHGGCLEAHSDGAGRGAVFTLRFPAVVRPIPAAPPSKATPPMPGSGQGSRVLLVEDHPDTSRLLCRVLTRWGYQVRSASSVASAIEAADTQPFDLLLSDLGLPDGSGLEVMQHMRQHSNTPGIAISGYGMEEDIVRSREAGFLEHLTKPIDLQQLDQSIQAILKTVAAARA